MDATRRIPAERWQGSARRSAPDTIVVEEPMEVRLGGSPVAVTMRTPGHDFDLAAGFLFTEGILSDPEQVGSIVYCSDSRHPEHNIVDVLPAQAAKLPEQGWQRSFHATSSCGLCGKSSIEAVRRVARPLDDPATFLAEVIQDLPERLRADQTLFAETGALHAAALCSPDGSPVLLREDIGRHNAVDKVIGSLFLAGRLPLRGHVLFVSGRASFEIVQKALMARIPAVAAVSGVSSLAAELADDSGMALIGFLRGRSMQVYAGRERIRES